MNLYIDVETYSSVDIANSGAYKYIESPDFEILIIGYAIDDGPVKTVDLISGDAWPEELISALQDPACLKIAHNAVFERQALATYGYNIPPQEWYDTLVKCAYCGLPLALDKVSQVLDLENKKLKTGTLLINTFSKPRKTPHRGSNTTVRRIFPWDAPDKWEMYKTYNRYDVLSEREIYKRLEKYVIPPLERKLYIIDQEINDNGILIDTELAAAAMELDTTYSAKILAQEVELTGMENPNSITQIKDWIYKETGRNITSLTKGTMPDLKVLFKNYPKILAFLDLRQKSSKISIKKYAAMLACAMSDHRARGMFQFYGAGRTGRWAGRRIQLQNLSKNHMPHLEVARELVRKKDLDTLEFVYDDVADVLSQLIRTAFIAPKGKLLAVADFSAIEARVISWLAGEEWRLEVFKGDGKIYEATGSRMFNVPIEKITKGSELRQKSKIAELALGYGGAGGALARMGGVSMGLSSVEMKDLTIKWRQANPKIVQFWADLEQAAWESIRYHRLVQVGHIQFNTDDNYMTIMLPSGRHLFYRHPTFRPKVIKKGLQVDSIYYEGLVQTTHQWALIDTFGGKLAENCCQAVARDLLGNAMINLFENGYKAIVASVHDELLIEVPEATAKEDYDNIIRLMTKNPSWAPDLPLRADGYTVPFYLKD